MLRKRLYRFFPWILIILLTGCIKEFIPEVETQKDMLVVEGLITDQVRTNKIKLSRSLPFGVKSESSPASGCIVRLSDDMGNFYSLKEKEAGIYITDSTIFKGVIGRFYTLHISTINSTVNVNYESYPMEMKSVPPIDSIYYEKTVIEKPYKNFSGIDGCQIFLDTHDPSNNCRFYRWDFSETWVLRLLFPVENQTCWISDKSNSINIKSTAAFDEARITRSPINYITNITDRLKRKYSILVNQYSLNEDEYIYWEKLQSIVDQVGGLYDIIPASVPGNIRCINYPGEKVLGYFSVSAMSSKRIFIKDNFEGIVNLYPDCPTDTVYVTTDPPGLGYSVWILDDEPFAIPPYKILTDKKGCADCTVRGSKIKPAFWVDDK